MKDFRDKPISYYMEDEIKFMTNKTLDEVRKYCVKKGWPTRVIKEDGKDCAITDDLKIFILNLTVEKNIVTSIECG